MKKVAMWGLGICLLAGLAIGPGYWAWGEFFSGEKIGEFPIMTREVDHTSVAGLSSTSAKGAEFSPVELELSPAMNPVGLIVTARAVPPTTSANRTRHATFRMIASQGDQDVWSEDFEISYRRKKEEKDTIKIGALGEAQFPTITQRLDLFRVPSAGTYALRAENRGSGDAMNDLVVTEMKMTARRNVRPADTRVVLAGVVILIASFAGLWTLKDRI